jgi:hypothetical protein
MQLIQLMGLSGLLPEPRILSLTVQEGLLLLH